MTTPFLKDKFRGVLLGMACGDALGAQVEFMPRGSFPFQENMTGAGPHGLKPGEWTDDTAMALILAEHLKEDPKVELPGALVRDWVGWMKHGNGSCTGECFDIGVQTASALRYWDEHKRRPKIDPNGCGNGALMRVAPVALANYGDRGAVRLAATRQAAITHPESSAQLCATFAAMVHDAVGRDPKQAQDYLTKYNKPIAMRLRRDVVSSGHDVATYEAALWCVITSGSLEQAITTAVNLGDDADTVGSVTGALAGAVWGATEIPSRWLTPLAWGPQICAVADYWFDKRGHQLSR